ncbi:hypothetical protein COCVIDRAFT_29521 [Bipolaris victoriae FI3]|uniref:Ecp2 effector protein domain-containing protein n=1 Tax=Bipolaris victoriae (strain FI3) TaxID=930091 RepID=W7E9B5_BIPV3|nr:hypothetical protein COCVIDRAFT_29521 [Bipolaris victoriae FI3]
MRSFSSILLALATATSILALPDTQEQPQIPDLPNGFFGGYNNPDGTSTLHFLDTNENITFTPTPAPSVPSRAKRAEEYGCWAGTLNRAGTDRAMNLMRERLSHTPIGVGQLNDWPAYFGYNENGVYVYACENSGGAGNYFYFERSHLDRMSKMMDDRCGAYVPGYMMDWWWLPTHRELFGKAFSGTAVCQGNWRARP